MKKVKTILISQPRPEGDKSPYFELEKKYKLKIDFRPFIEVKPISAQDFRQERISILDHTAVIFTSRNAVDHYFRMCGEMRITVPDSMKYFCVSEAVAYYLQKYIVYRKRKISFGKLTFADLMTIIKKNEKEKFLLPSTDIYKKSIPETLKKNGINFTIAVLYRTVAADLSDLDDVTYDILVFFSPSGIESLYKNFPDFKQKDTCIAVFGPATAKAAKDVGLKTNIPAPTPDTPSMSLAIENHIKKANK